MIIKSFALSLTLSLTYPSFPPSLSLSYSPVHSLTRPSHLSLSLVHTPSLSLSHPSTPSLSLSLASFKHPLFLSFSLSHFLTCPHTLCYLSLFIWSLWISLYHCSLHVTGHTSLTKLYLSCLRSLHQRT